MSKPATTRRATKDVRVHLYRDQDGRWRWRMRVPAHNLADSGQGYSRRIDCLHAAMRTTGVAEITWLARSRSSDYGQASFGRMGVDFIIWHKLVEARP